MEYLNDCIGILAGRLEMLEAAKDFGDEYKEKIFLLGALKELKELRTSKKEKKATIEIMKVRLKQLREIKKEVDGRVVQEYESLIILPTRIHELSTAIRLLEGKFIYQSRYLLEKLKDKRYVSRPRPRL